MWWAIGRAHFLVVPRERSRVARKPPSGFAILRNFSKKLQKEIMLD
jgi:hypothetical protein